MGKMRMTRVDDVLSVIAWDYEDSIPGYYHIYGVSGPLQDLIITLDAPECPENDADVQAIVNALVRISTRTTIRQGQVEDGK